MAWMPHRAIDQPQMQRVRDRIMSKPFRALPWGTFFDQLAALVKIPEDALQELDYGIDR
jgi:hypothetical protein